MADEKKSLKSSWADFGKGMGKSMAGLTKAIIKSAQVGLDKADGTIEPGEDTGLKEKWSEVGHSFGHTGASLGKAAEKTLNKIVGDEETEKAEKAENTEGEAD